jgi:uncharacterized protein
VEHEAQNPGEPSPEDPPPTTYAPPPLVPPPAARLSEPEARTFGMLAHLAAFGGFVVPGVGHIVGPLVVWLIKKDEHPFVDDQGKESLNFQLSMSLYYVVSVILMFVLIGFLIFPGLVIFSVVVTILGAIKANSGERYRYPLNIRFIK